MKEFVLPLFATLACSLSAFAGQELSEAKKTVIPAQSSVFEKGHLEIEVGAGAFGSIGTKGSAERPDVGFAIGQARVGLMLSDPMGSGLFRGNIEALLEGFGAGIFTGPGDQIYGASFILRWNFVQPGARIVPFVQIQGGGAYSDMANDDATQRLIGSDWSFTFGAEVGVRCFLTPTFALTTGVEYRHISNADTADRNRGLNGLGGTIGFSWFR